MKWLKHIVHLLLSICVPLVPSVRWIQGVVVSPVRVPRRRRPSRCVGGPFTGWLFHYYILFYFITTSHLSSAVGQCDLIFPAHGFGSFVEPSSVGSSLLGPRLAASL